MTRPREGGYAMAALLVSLSVMAVLMGAMLPVWSQMAQREKEEELIFRGQQYARAIGLFQRKFANTAPPSIDLLVEQRFLRKKYKDPITNDDFQPLFVNQAPQTVGSPSGSLRPGETGTSNRAVMSPTPAIQGSTGPGAPGGIIGVTSKSKETSIKIYNGRTKYNEWSFVYVQTAQRPAGPGTTQTPGQQQPPGQQRPGQPSPMGSPGMPGMQPGLGSGGRAPRPPVEFPGTTFTPITPTPPPGTPRRPGQ
jgi:type II secretory pathway pseudopilin PulG